MYSNWSAAQMLYMTGMINFASLAEAKINQPINHKNYVIEEHKDGSAVIVYLQDTPVQKGQVPYTGGK